MKQTRECLGRFARSPTRKMVPIARRASSLHKKVCTILVFKKNRKKEEMETEQNRPINLL